MNQFLACLKMGDMNVDQATVLLASFPEGGALEAGEAFAE
jgi:hypothetical protein